MKWKETNIRNSLHSTIVTLRPMRRKRLRPLTIVEVRGQAEEGGRCSANVESTRMKCCYDGKQMKKTTPGFFNKILWPITRLPNSR